MAALREHGCDLAEIALRYGVSRERVRQILRANGGPDAQVIAAARRRRADLQAEARVDELLALWRSGIEPAGIAAALGLRAAACRNTIARFATDVDRAARQATMADARGRGSQTYSEHDILVALKAIADRLGRVPTPREYDALARELGSPSLPTVLNRMGSWTIAVRAAGMQPRGFDRSARSRRWTEEACWAALRRAVEELGEVPSVLAYERHVAGRAELPSAATLRKRVGRWSAITTRLAAERELVALHQPPTAATGASRAPAHGYAATSLPTPAP